MSRMLLGLAIGAIMVAMVAPAASAQQTGLCELSQTTGFGTCGFFASGESFKCAFPVRSGGSLQVGSTGICRSFVPGPAGGYPAPGPGESPRRATVLRCVVTDIPDPESIFNIAVSCDPL